jgi:hypothetical protein
MTVEGALLIRERNRTGVVDYSLVDQASRVLADEVIRLRRLLALAGHAYKHDGHPSREVLREWGIAKRGDSSAGSEQLPSKQQVAGSSPAPRSLSQAFKC